jgi:hypothetical protein
VNANGRDRQIGGLTASSTGLPATDGASVSLLAQGAIHGSKELDARVLTIPLLGVPAGRRRARYGTIDAV